MYNEQLNDDQLSPAEANKVSHQLHCSIQACIFCIKAHFNDSNELDDSVKSEFAEIATKCTEMLDNPRIPMDTKNNCSMLIILHSKLSCNEDYLKLVADDEGSPTKKLCIIFGVINAMAKADVNYKVLADMSLILKECYMKSSIEPPLMLSISRSMMQITKKLVVFDYDEMTEDIAIITDSTLSIAFLNIQHHLDTVRHLARDSLRNLSEIASKQQDGKLIECIFKGIGGLCLSSQSIIIFSIAQVTPAKVILEKLPHLLSSILSAVSSNQGTASNFINCYEAVAVKSLEEFPFNESFNIFAVPALNEMMRHQPQSDERLILESLLMALGKNEKKILEEIMKRRESFDIGFTLLCLSTLKKMGLYEKAESSSELWRGIVSFKEIQNAMINANESVRSSSFALVAESRKTTEGFMQQELDCIIYFLNYNINVQSPSMRQSILGIVKNLFIRIRAIVLGLTRRNESAEFYFNFLVQLQEFCLENLFEGANFTRRVLSLRILFYVVDAFAECFCDKAASVWDQNKIDVLMNVLNDSYEANKEMAVEIMKSIPKEILRRFCCISLNHLETMVKSIKPPENITATYLIEVKTKFALNLDEFDGVKSIVSPESLLMLTWCEDILIAGLEIAEKSLSVAASTNPLYGLIQSIRHLLSKLNLKALGGCMLWRDFFKRLIVLCKRLTRVVAPVVNNSSPEGILPPEEFQGLEDVTRKEWMRIAECTTPQIILLCSWRTIKEVSLLLGDVCLKAPIISNDTGLLEVEQILNIGDHFLELLSKTKHRGAFEQCFFGFSQLCMRLWTCHEPELHKLPSEMLHQMITSISGHDKENNELLSMKNLTATRRSAGLPFMIQALITSELKVSTNKNFHFVMKNLMNFCLQGEYLETRTHSLNILRALFRCSDLNEAIGEYIADGIKCAILGIGAESWVERNSSTLLFSALMVRIFGVQRTKDSDDLGIRNRMTGRVFFLRYPLLFDFFMLQLNEAAEYVKAVKMNAKLHPLLLLLIRLYPSALEGSATKLELAEFVPVVALCSGCVEIQTRILCAKFIASATPPDQLMTRITSTLNFLGENEDLPANIAHGILLQILYLVKSIATAGADKEAGDGLIALLQDVCLMGHRFNSQLICYGTFLDIVIEVLEKCWHRAHDRFTRIKQSLDSCRKFDDKSLFGSAVVMKKLFLIEQIKFYLQYQDQLDIIPDHPYLFDSFINNVLLSMDLDYALAMQEEYELNPKEIFFIKNLPANTREKLRDQRRNDQSIKKFMLRLLKDVDCQIKAYDVLSLMKYNAGDVTQSEVESLIETAREAPEHYKHVLLKFANTCIRSEMWIERFDFKFLVEISTDASFYVKYVELFQDRRCDLI